MQIYTLFATMNFNLIIRYLNAMKVVFCFLFVKLIFSFIYFISFMFL